MIIDEIVIKCIAGKGGDGIVSFRREKFIPKGGPDGGDGGSGGNIYIKSDSNLNNLNFLTKTKEINAEDGENGKSKKMYGRNGKDYTIFVPLGTKIYDLTKNYEEIIDVVDDKVNYLVCKGGKAGLGNTKFKSSTNRVPREYTKGGLGENKVLKFVLEMIADVGIIGLPNAGKSSLLNSVTNSKVKIGEYPFTTIYPNLGLLKYGRKKIVLADIPGLIENASKGKGLGINFLKHISRTKILLHIIDGTSENIFTDYETVRNELKNFDSKLTKKLEIIAINKSDNLSDSYKEKIKKNFFKHNIKHIFFISTITLENLNLIKKELIKLSA